MKERLATEEMEMAVEAACGINVCCPRPPCDTHRCPLLLTTLPTA